ncbi:MAG: NifB/NifX family molybdenum-iron cluster-binding protein [Magnetovibrionaceae bacterium]
MVRHLKIVDKFTDNGEELSWKDRALRVAFASTDMKHIDQHFGSASCFAIYGVDPDQFHMIDVIQFGDLKQDGDENKLLAKFEALEDCAAVYIQAIGASAINQLRALGVQPVKVSHGTPITEMLQALSDELRDGPRNWLARAIERQNAPDDPEGERFKDMEAEGWEE